MIRKQLYISEVQERGLKRLASATGQSEAWHVRAALDRYLAADPLSELVGLAATDDGPTDVAEAHDRYAGTAAEGPGEYRSAFSLDSDVAIEVQRLRREEGLGLSEAINTLIRRAMTNLEPPEPYEHKTAPIGIKVDITNIADVLEVLDDAR